jgi:hypothetical protein
MARATQVACPGMNQVTHGGEVTQPPGEGTRAEETLRTPLSRVGLAALLALPGALIVYFAFNSGGTFEVTTALGALVVLVAMLLGLAVAFRPLAALAPRGLFASGLLALFAIWTLASAGWSDATGPALVSLNRTLLYLAVLILFACIPSSTDRFRWLLRGLLAGIAVVSIIGLLSRLLPGVWETSPGLVSDRLNYPITYWNTFALLVGMGCILATHQTSDEHEPPAIRIGAAALLPILGATLLLTFSRGAIAVTALGILAYVMIARPRGLLGAILAVVPPTAFAVIQTYSSEMVQEGTPLTPAALGQAHDLALMIGACALVAGLLRALALRLDTRMSRISISPSARRTGWIGAACAAMLVLLIFLAAGGPSSAHHQYEKFINDARDSNGQAGGQRDRLLSIGDDGRLPLWQGALDAYRDDPLKGTGAGTYRQQMEQSGRSSYDRFFAYSLYIETLGELGLVGITLLGATLLTILVGIAVGMRGPARPVYSAAFALVIAWVVHAGVDIDWQTPAVTVPIFALGGFALARRKEQVFDRVASQSDGRLLQLSGAFRTSRWASPALPALCLVIAIFPARMALAQTHLQKSIDALTEGECKPARTNAEAAVADLDTGPRPYEVLAMCSSRSRDSTAAIRWATLAVAHNPGSWEPHYVLALAQASAGLDPRTQARIASKLNPNSYFPNRALAAFRSSNPVRWKAAAAALPFSMS